MSIVAEITFNKIPRPPYAYRYLGNQCWMRMDSNEFQDLPCYLIFPEGEEYYDEDTTDVALGFYEGETNINKLSIGTSFVLRILNLEVAKGTVKSVS